jgi:prepilin-type N-terminal cleavage/methylation domain-containing protein
MRPPFAETGAGSAPGLTLLELLVVVAVMAMVAGGVVTSLAGVRDVAAGRLGRYELAELRRAVRQFRNDTGCWPKHGPFDLVTDGGEVPVPAEGEAWFRSPANLGQLFKEPQDAAGDPIRPWDPVTGRGWRGPYLTRGGDGTVEVGDGLEANGDGSPASGALLSPMRGVGDPFEAPPVGAVGYCRWTNLAGSRLDRWGRPYLMCLDDPRRDGDPANDAELGPRIVCLGPNGTYESDRGEIRGDDLAVFLLE